MNKTNTDPKDDFKKKKDPIPRWAWFALAIFVLLLGSHIASYKAGQNNQHDYFGPAKCTEAFHAIANGLADSKDEMAAAILDEEAPEGNAEDVRKLVKECTGDLPVIKTTTTTTEGK